uniref:Uncharacterized protein n=1 Tax=Arundo donax TaxID=35708 RepID=A0A0A9DBZ9_ARUDO
MFNTYCIIQNHTPQLSVHQRKQARTATSRRQHASIALKLQPPSSSTALSAGAVSWHWGDILCRTRNSSGQMKP